MVFRGDGNVRVAKSLLTLFDQVDAAFPGRAKGNDGTIGDANHAATKSDHNPTTIGPDGMGVICALDITHDPAHGFDAGQFAETLRLNRDQRIKYVIFNGRIFNSTESPWIWRARNKGPGDHSEHVHISAGRGPDGHSTNPELYDNALPWAIDSLPRPPISVPSGGRRFTNIKATVFNDTELAYGPKPADFMGYSLPGRITGELPLRITNRATGLSAIANKCDIGPWYDGRPGWPEDRWWENGTRPRAETDPRTNGAGIDLYPAVASALGIQVVVGSDGSILAGEAQVDVEIISEKPMAEQTDIAAIAAAVQEILVGFSALRKDAATMRLEIATLRSLVTGEQAPTPAPTPPSTPDRAPTDPFKPANFGSLIASIAAMIALPANNITGTLDQGTFGSLLPLATAVASAFGVPGWIFPPIGRFISRLTGAQK